MREYGDRKGRGADVTARGVAIARFVGGVVWIVGLGCAFAAVDLWGGVRALGVGPRFLGISMVLAATLVLSGAVGWVRSWPLEERPRRALVAALALALFAAVGGGGLFAYYAARLRPSAVICGRAQCAATRAERDRRLQEGLGPLFPVIDPAYECVALERERRALESSRACPTVVLDDTPCRCGQQEWSAGHPARCPGGKRTTCESRGGGGPSLGCAGEFVAAQLLVCTP